ncbi:MAG: CPBP family intramembrane metalloprotease [Acidobacteriota bacterium]|nr:CPBP family intramembrane metalloprotease [Acidobacteriota bacterium]
MSNPNEPTTLPIPEESDSIYQAGLRDQFQYQAIADNPAWGLGGALLVWFASVTLIVVMPLLFLLPYASRHGLHMGAPDYGRELIEFAVSDKTAVLLQVVSLFPSHLLTLLLVWVLVTRLGKRSFWTAIGWGWPRYFPWWWSVLLGMVLFVLGSVVARLLGADKPTQLEQIINSSLAARYALSLLAVGTAPFVEEFIYRGVLYAPLQKIAGVRGAVVIVLALFTIIHVPQYWPNVGVIAAVALLSIVLTLVRAYSGRLLPCIVIHLVFNGIQAVILMLEPYAHHFLPTTEQTAPTVTILLPLIRFTF